MNSDCPICGRTFPTRLLERHVNSCLDSQEIPIDQESKRDMFSVLGLQMDRKKKEEVKVVKNRPSLTSILIEERRLRKKQNGNREDEGSFCSSEATFEATNEAANGSSDANESVIKEEILEDVTEEPAAETTEANPTTDITTEAPDVSIDTLAPVPADMKPVAANTVKIKQINLAELQAQAVLPLAQRLRPTSLSDFHGQEALLGPHGLLRNIINSTQIPSFLLWGPPGVGKTSIARIIAKTSNYKFVELLGADSNTKRLKEEFDRAENEKQLTGRQTILFLDEIHRFNRAVQDLLLPVIERGTVTVIGATTENPLFTLNNALLSRCHTFIMEPLSVDLLIKVLSRGLLQVNTMRKYLYHLHFISLRKDALVHLAELAMGDSRVVLNLLESINAYFSTPEYSSKERVGVININSTQLKPILVSRNFQQMYDRQADGHYDNISALHKAVRGSDADASIFYLTKMLMGGEDPLFIIRRMIVMASEDIGLRDSTCLPFTIAAKEALEFVGMPEGEIILAQVAVKLARAPKSKKSYKALRAAQKFLKENPQAMQLPVPMHLRNAPTGLMKDLGYGEEYRHNPDYSHGRVNQSYLPPELEGKKFVGEHHMGTERDVKVSEEEYRKAEKDDEYYQTFKQEKRRKLKERWAIDNSVNAFTHSYDENLPKESQPSFFDGEERDVYSDDPDAVSNFNAPYDEFLDENAEVAYQENDDTDDDTKPTEDI